MARSDRTASCTLVAILSACLVTAAGEERPTPPERIKYVIFVPGMEIWEFDTRLQERPGGGTVATFEHRITSLAPEVNPEVQAFSDGFEAYVGRLKTALSAELHPTP